MTAVSAAALSRIVSRLMPEDWPLIVQLARDTWPVSYANILTKEQIDNMLERIYTAQNLQQEMADGHVFWAIHEDGVPAGFASAYKQEGVIWLKKLYVLPELQGKGLGRNLMNAIISHFAPAGELKLLVNRRNTPAQHFYTRLGFACIAEVPVRMGDFEFIDFVFSKAL